MLIRIFVTRNPRIENIQLSPQIIRNIKCGLLRIGKQTSGKQRVKF